MVDAVRSASLLRDACGVECWIAFLLADIDIEMTLWRHHMGEDCLVHALRLTFVGALIMELESERRVETMPSAQAVSIRRSWRALLSLLYEAVVVIAVNRSTGEFMNNPPPVRIDQSF